MERESNRFSLLLLQASKATGSLLGVADLLGVEPLQVYRWIAHVDPPPTTRRCEFEERLKAVIA